MRLLHTMLRVGDLQRSIDFYTKVLGMKLLRTTDRPDQKYTLAFVGYGANPEHAELELTYNSFSRSSPSFKKPPISDQLPVKRRSAVNSTASYTCSVPLRRRTAS